MFYYDVLAPVARYKIKAICLLKTKTLYLPNTTFSLMFNMASCFAKTRETGICRAFFIVIENKNYIKSSQLGFIRSINAIFAALFPAFNCFSLAIASPIIWKDS